MTTDLVDLRVELKAIRTNRLVLWILGLVFAICFVHEWQIGDIGMLLTYSTAAVACMLMALSRIGSAKLKKIVHSSTATPTSDSLTLLLEAMRYSVARCEAADRLIRLVPSVRKEQVYA